MGEVYRFGDQALQRDLAIKVLKEQVRGDAAAEQRFLREARLTGSLQHPGVVPVHQLGRLADGRPCYTMKLVRGRTLADLLCQEPDGPERLPRLLAIVEAIQGTLDHSCLPENDTTILAILDCQGWPSGLPLTSKKRAPGASSGGHDAAGS
jgi:serine/threonine-protein kinase